VVAGVCIALGTKNASWAAVLILVGLGFLAIFLLQLNLIHDERYRSRKLISSKSNQVQTE
jgi:hypothetical protein